MPSSAAPPIELRAAHSTDADARVDACKQQLAAERTARERAEIAAHARDQFLSIAAHDLRSPLNGIQSWTNVLQMQIPADASPLMVRALAGIKNGVEQQARLIEELLDTARILNGSLELHITDVSAAAAIQAAVAQAGDLAATRGVRLATETTTSPDLIRADAARLEQMARLLLSNALASAPQESGVTIALACSDGSLRLRVKHQGLASRTGAEGIGAGESEARTADIGLLLVRRLAEFHGGSFLATTANDGSTTLEVALPPKDSAR